MFEPSTNVILDCAKWTGTVYCDGIAYSCQVTIPPSRGAESWEGSLSVIKCEKPGGEILIEEKIICNRRFLDEYVIRLLIEGRVGKLAPGKVLTSRMNFLTWTGTGADYFPGTDVSKKAKTARLRFPSILRCRFPCHRWLSTRQKVMSFAEFPFHWK